MKMMGSHDTATPWGMSSLITAPPEPPSLSATHTTRHPHHHSHTFIVYSDNATEFSTPRSQEFGVDNNNECSICFSEIDEWLEQANKFCRSYTYDQFTESVHLGRNENPEEEDLRISAVCSKFPTVPDHELHHITLPSIREESPVFHSKTDYTCINSKYEAFRFGSNEHRRFMWRPRPYEEFLNEVRRKEQEAEREARRKAKHIELMHRMRRKEEAINDWETQQTRRAMDKMDKIQNELERKQRMASAKTQKKLSLVMEKAEKQKLSLRRSTMKQLHNI